MIHNHKQFLGKKILSTIAVAAALGLSACGGGGGGGSTPANSGSQAADIPVSGNAADGYLVDATVCLDLNQNGICDSGTEPTTSTDTSGGFKFMITPAQQQNGAYKTAPLIVYGGYDKDTGTDFTGKLQSLYDPASPVINVTPVTTMINAVATAQNMTPENAKEVVASVLGIDVTTLGKDPVALAKQGYNGLYLAALKLQKSVNVLAQAQKKKDGSVNLSAATTTIYSAIARKLDAQSGAPGLTMAIQQAAGNDNLLQAKIAATVTAMDNLGSSADSVAMMGVLADKLETDVNTATTNDMGNIKLSTDSYAELRAKSILAATGLSTPSFSTVAAVLTTAGETGASPLTPTEEIAVLKNNSSVQAVGTAYAAYLNHTQQ